MDAVKRQRHSPAAVGSVKSESIADPENEGLVWHRMALIQTGTREGQCQYPFIGDREDAPFIAMYNERNAAVKTLCFLQHRQARKACLCLLNRQN